MGTWNKKGLGLMLYAICLLLITTNYTEATAEFYFITVVVTVGLGLLIVDFDTPTHQGDDPREMRTKEERNA